MTRLTRSHLAWKQQVRFDESRYALIRRYASGKGVRDRRHANVRTDLDAFSEVDQAVLMNHGFALIDAAIRTHAPELTATDAMFALPFQVFAPPTAAEVS